VDARRGNSLGYQGPAFLVKMRGALDSGGSLVAYDFHARSCDHNHVGYNEPDTVLIAQLMGSRRPKPAAGSAAMSSDMYAIPNRKMVGEIVGLPTVWETPLRTGNLRDPNGPQSTFAAESFIDEMAAAAKADPLDFRIEDAQSRHARRQRIPSCTFYCGSQSCRGNLWLGLAAFAETDRQGEHLHRTRDRVLVPGFRPLLRRS
jgi:hypothetical protein